MKIETLKNFETKSIGGEVDSIQANIASDSMEFLFEMMSKSLYSDPIGSIIREITSNCFDSHQEAKIDDAVVIKKGDDDEGDYISFNDYGVGLSPERIRNVYMNYFSSTKRDTNDQIGGFGLGSKTPLSYVDYFYINTNFNGKKYNYILSKGEKLPTLDLLNEEDTTERNGTEVRIYIQNSNDIGKFSVKLKTQLCYFDNVYFDKWDINNDYKIYDLQYFKYRNKDQYSSEMHIILGKVSYPINWKEIGLTPMQIPIGVKFEIGELVVTPNRESLRYTDEVKKIVGERVISALKECLDLYNSQNRIIDNYFEWFDLKNTRPYVSFRGNNIDHQEEDKLYLPKIEGIDKKHKCSIFGDIKFLEEDNLLSKLYTFVGSFYNGFISKDKTGINLSTDHTKVFIGNVNTIREDFAYTLKNGIVFKPINLTHKFFKNNGVFTSITDIKKYNKETKEVPLSSFEEFNDTKDFEKIDSKYKYFNLGIAHKLYKAIKIIRSQCEEKWNLYREITDDEKSEFKKWKDKSNLNLQRKLAGKVLVKSISEDLSYDWRIRNIKNSDKETICGIDFYKGIIIYGFRDDGIKLQRAITFLGQFKTLLNTKSRSYYGGNKYKVRLNVKACKVIQISQSNEKYFKDKPNMIHVDKLYTDNKLFKKLASSIKIEEYFVEIGKHQTGGSENFISELSKICNGVGFYLKQLQEYYENTSNIDLISGSQIERSDLRKEILDIATKYNLFDPNIELIFRQLDNWFKGVEIIKFTDINEDSLPFIIKLLGDNKKKLNLEFYQAYIEKCKVFNIDPYTIRDSDNNKIGIQETLQFEDIEEKIETTKLKFIINKIA